MRGILLITALAASALAGPTGQRESCAVHCNYESVFSYQQGKSYVYQYEATTSTALLNTLEETADVHVTATAHIDVTSPCEYTLRLTAVNLDGSSHSQEFATAVTKSPLRFAFQDGQVESVCGEVSEPAWVLNFKRGVLSTFQSTVSKPGKQDIQETDISGTCVTHYSSSVDGNVLTVDKVKDLKSCTQRPDLAAYIASTAYVSDSPIQSLPIFNSDNKCHQTIEGGVLKTAECQETHKFRPFSTQDGGAVTSVKTTLVLVSHDQPAAASPSYEFVRKSPVFEQTTPASAQAEVEVVNQILADLDQAAHDEIRPQVPTLFSNLVASLKPLDYPTLATLYSSAKGSRSLKFLVDAMPMVGTAAAVGVVKDMFINGDITETEADVWFTSLAFFKNPTADMFTAIAPLLEANPSQNAMLGTSALVNTFCKLNARCSSEPGVEQVLRIIESQLGSGCRTISDVGKMKVMVALKALGNAGRWVNANSILQRCYTEDNAMEVRVAAIEAWRHTPCEYDRSHLLAAFQDETQDSEIRIAAYLAVMTCPTETVIATVKDRLTSEAVNQVGSFIWTHLTNLQESAAPGKQWVRELIGEELLSNKFSTEALKFSRNYESSFFTDELNVGAAVESNVIFSTKSYLPRSAMLNFTIDLFGESINLFEVGGRIQGFESYVEKFFGPSGYFPQETIEGVLKHLHETKPDSDATTLEDFLDRVTDEPEGSYYLRIFGNELHYNHFHGLDNLLHTSNPLDLLMELVRGGDIDYTKSFQLIDSDYSIPTVCGLPVTLNAKGTATLALRMNGNLNANSLTNFNIEGHFHPSAAVQMDGVMMVDAHVTRKGLKVSSTLHTSTFVDGKVHINGGKLVDVAINTPEDRVEVIDVKTKFFILEDNDLTETEPENQAVVSCSRGSIGMSLCVETNYLTGPNYWQPYGGRIYFLKTDSLTGYILKYTKNENEVSLLMDTPGSQRNHKIYFNIRKTDNSLHFNLDALHLSADGNAEYVWQRDRKGLNISVNFGNSVTSSLTAELVTRLGDETRIEPSLIVNTGYGQLINAKGALISSPAQRKHSLEMTISGTVSPFSFRASYEGAERSAKVNMAVESRPIDLYVQGNLEYDQTSIFWDNEIEYAYGGRGKQIIKYGTVLRREVSDENTTYSMKFDLSPTQYSQHPVLLEYKVITSPGHMESSGTLIHSQNVVWNFEEIWTYVRDETQLAWTGHAKVTCPYYGLEKSSSNEFRLTRSEVYLSLKRKDSPQSTYEITMEAKKNEDREMMLRAVYKLDWTATFEALYTKIADGHYNAQVTGSFEAGSIEKALALEGSLINNSEPGKIDVATEASFKIPGKTFEGSFTVAGDAEKAKMEVKSKVDRQPYNLLMEATRSSLLVDTDVFKHIVVNAYVNRDEKGTKVLAGVEWDKDNDATKALVFRGKIMDRQMEATLKYLGREIIVSGQIQDGGMAVEGRWAPDKTVKISLNYELFVYVKRSLTVAVETPFPGWQKQDATVSVALSQNEFNAQAMANWKNSQQMALAINANLQPGFTNNALYANVLFSSPFNNFERLTFVLDHKMAAVNINTNMEATWNDNKINGVILLTPTENGIDGSATFTSPFTQEAAITLHHELVQTKLASSLQAKYGQHVSTATLEGHVITQPGYDIALHLKVPALLESVPEIEVDVKYDFDSTSLAFVTEGNAGESKFMFSVNGTKTVAENSSITGDVRFITPFTRPLTATLSHTHDSQNYDTKLVVTSNGSMTFQSTGHVLSRNDIEVSAAMDTPNTKVSFTLSHKISNNNLLSYVKTYANDEDITVSLSGTLDEAFNVANLEGEVNSTFDGLDDMKMKLNSVKQGSGRTTKIILSHGAKSVNIVHNISYTNKFNWDHSFVINNNYKLRNTQTHTGMQYGHEMEVNWDDKTVSIKGNFDAKSSGFNESCVVHLAITTPWEYMEDIDINLNALQTVSDLKLGAALKDKQKTITELTYWHRYKPGSFFFEVSLATPFWETLAFKLRGQDSPRTVTLILLYGEAQTSVTVGGEGQSGKMNGHINITSDLLSTPIAMEGSLDVASDEKTITITVTTDNTYQLTGSMSGEIWNAMLFLSLDLPLDYARHIEYKGEYQAVSFPFTLNTEMKVDSREYNVNGRIDPSSFHLEVDANGQRGSARSNWEIQHSKANVELHIQSPFSSLTNVGANIMYDFESAKKFDAKVTYNNQEVTLSGKLEGRTFIIEGTTPFRSWENLSASLFLSNSAITASASRNDNKIEVTGTLHLKSQKGKAELSITTPCVGHETIHLEAIYNFNGDSKTVQFKSNYNNAELSIKGAVNLSNLQAPEMTLNLVTPFPEVRNLRAEAKWNVMNPVKTAEVVAHHDSGVYNWRLEATSANPLTGHITTKLSTPLPDLSDVSLKAAFDFTAMPYTVSTEYKRGDVVKKLEGHLLVTGNAIQGDITTPITGWEAMTLNGEYYRQEDHLTGAIEINKGSERFEVKSDILFNKATPRIKVEVKTPVPEYTNMELSMESSLTEMDKKFKIAFIINDITYSADITGRFARKDGTLQAVMKSPITGFTSLEIASEYDFTGDVKVAELNVKKEGQTQRFSVTGGVDGNNIVLDVITPYENFEVMKMNADYVAQPGLHKVSATFTRDINEYKFVTEVAFNANSATIKLSTPIEAIKNVEVKGMVDIQDDRVTGSVIFQRNDDVFNLNSSYIVDPMKSQLEIGVATPIPGWSKIGLYLNYDLISDRKVAEVVMLKNDVVKQLALEAYYNLERGSLQLRTPVEGFEFLGADYTLVVDSNNNKLEALVRTNYNSQEWTLSAFGQYSTNEIVVRLQTPFHGFETISIEGSINNSNKTGEGIVHIGSYTFTINASYALNNMFLEMRTPYTPLSFFLVSFKYSITPRQMEGTMNVSVNDESYMLHGGLQNSPRSSGLVLTATTAIPHIPNMSLQIKYDLDNVDQIVFVEAAADENEYKLSMGGYIQEGTALFKCDLTTPFIGWRDVKFQTKIDLLNEDKMLEIYLERNGSVKEIAIHGKLIGTEVNFDLRTPFTGLHRFNASGNLNRAKRSLEFQMMNDAGQASIAASFQQVKLNVKTPFERFEEVTWDIKKEAEGKYVGEWRRNDNFVTVDIERQGTGGAVNVQVRSEVNGWEFLGLTGRLDTATYEAYLSGQRNERKVEISISGKHDPGAPSSYTINIKTPYENYSDVKGNLRYNLRRRQLKLLVESESSDFKLDVQARRGLQVVLHVPHPEKNTDLQIDLTRSKGTIFFDSRFQRLPTYKQEYEITTNPLGATGFIEVNGQRIFNLECAIMPQEKKFHLEIHTYRGDRHTTIHMHSEGYTTSTFLIKQETGNTAKELKVEMTGSGNLPTQGTLHFDISNTFAEPARQSTIHVEVDRRSENKKIKIEATLPGNKLYVINIDYNINLRDLRHGEYTIAITTPDRRMRRWNNISGNWNLEDLNRAVISLTIGGQTYTARGKVGLRDSELILTPEGEGELIYLQWRFIREGDNRDYFLKVGRESRYVMFKLKGAFNPERGNVEFGCKLGRLQRYEFHCTNDWTIDAGGTVTASGTFNYAQYQGNHELQYTRNAAERSAVFNFSLRSNNPEYKSVKVHGSYDMNNKFKVNFEVNVNERVSRVDIDISDFNPRRSRNIVQAHIPILGEYASFDLTLQHDFRNLDNRYIHAIANIGQREAYIKANWKRSANLDTLEGTIDIKSRFVGEIHVSGNWDISDYTNARAEAQYKRIRPERGDEITGHLTWKRIKTDNHLENELLIDSTSPNLSHLRAFTNVDFSEGFHLTSGLEVNERHVNIKINIGNNSVSGEITTPFPGFESIKGIITYSLTGKNQTITLKYERGDRHVDMSLVINRKSKRKGDLEFSLTTPFQSFREMKITANWNKKQAVVEYMRNDVRISMTGTAKYEGSKSEFNFTFNTPEGKRIVLGAAYDVSGILEGQGTEPQKIASLELGVDEMELSLTINGFRNPERIYLEISGHASLLQIRTFYLKLNSELNADNRTGIFELIMNDFVFKVENNFERYENNEGYYLRSKIESSLTPLPALVLGLGYKDDERIITVGYGEDKEITFSLKSDSNYRNGFSGFVNIPNFGYDEGVKYEVEYRFPNENQLLIDLDVDLGEGGQEIEAHFQYDSEGVQARLTSPYTGRHSVRARRSISSDSFFTEIGYNEYSLKLRGGFNNDDIKRGAVLEGEVFGHQFLIDYLFQTNGLRYSEGKLIIQTPFQGMQNMGGLFTLSTQGAAVEGQAELLLPFSKVPKITLDVDINLNRKIEGHVTLDIAGAQFILRTNVVGVSPSRGKVEIFTPFRSVSHVTLEGAMKMEGPTKFGAEFKLVEPYTTHRFEMEFELNPNKVIVSASLRSVSYSGVRINFTLEGLQEMPKKLDLQVNNDKLTAEYNMNESAFIVNINTLYQNVPRQLSISAQFPSLQNMAGSLVVILGEMKHNINGEFDISTDRVKGEIYLESTLIEGNRQLKFDISIPSRSFKQVIFDLSLTTSQTHSVHFEFDSRTRVEVRVRLDTPAMENINAVFEFSGAAAQVTIETPSDTHKAKVSWRMTRKMPADYTGTVELDSPFLGQPYKLSVLVGGGRMSKTLKVELQVGTTRHLLEGNMYLRSNAGGFSFTVETPFKNIEKAVLEASLLMSDKIKVHAAASLPGNEHSFDSEFDVEKNAFMAEAKSPCIPTGLVKIEATLYGDPTDMKLNVVLMNAEDTISGNLIVKCEPSDVLFKLEIATPIPDFQNLNGMLKLTTTEQTNFIFFLDYPIILRVNAKFSNAPNLLTSNVKVNTSIQHWEYLEADFSMPLDKFAPRATLEIPGHKYGAAAEYETDGYTKMASANLFLDDEVHGGRFNIRTKAPYDLGYDINFLRLDSRFHLRTDSSFFSLLM